MEVYLVLLLISFGVAFLLKLFHYVSRLVSVHPSWGLDINRLLIQYLILLSNLIGRVVKPLVIKESFLLS